MDKLSASYHSPEVTSDSLHLTPEFVNGRVFGWGPTPLDSYLPGPVVDQQRAVYEGLRERVRYNGSLRPDIPQHIRDYMETSFDSRFHQHASKSYDNFMQSGAPMDQELLDKCGYKLELSLRGLAYPGDQLDVMQAAKMRAIELGYITVAYGDRQSEDYDFYGDKSRMKEVDEMRKSVGQAVLDRGGRLLYPSRENPDRYKVRHCDEMIEAGENHVKDGILITRKRTTGIIESEDLHIMERSSFILRIDEASGFDQEVADKIRTVKVGHNSSWQERIWRLGNFKKLVPRLLAANDFNQIIPIAVTSYAYCETMDDLIRDERLSVSTNDTAQLVIGREALAQSILGHQQLDD